MSLCKHCVSGSVHEGSPKGRSETIEGHEVYIATPSGDYPKDKALLMLTDVFGLPLVNNKLLADSFAENGLLTYMPDYLNKDAIPVEEMESGKFNIGEWFPNHTPEKTMPALKATMDHLRSKGITTFGAVGYCFGARYVFNLAYDGLIKVGANNHPSLIQPEDLEKIGSTGVPMLFNTCETDQQFPKEKQELADKLLGGKTELYKRNYWPGQTHGFAVRGDFSKPENKKAADEAFKASYEWIAAHL